MTVPQTLTDDLYHYTSAEVALDSILAQAQFRLGLVEWMNDPREARQRYPSLQQPDGASSDGVEDLWEEADRLMRRATKVACFTLDYELPDSVLDRNALRGYAHPALWAHYGGDHAGVCLRFSRRALADRIEAVLGPRGQLFHGSVEYTLHPSRISRALDLEQVSEFGLDAVVAEYIRVHHRELYFSKHQDWSGEYEYRWVLVEPGPLPAYVDITDV